jgi:hypothetical protein
MKLLIKNVINTVNKYFIPSVPLKHIHLFRFGLLTISLPNFQSLNSNARVWGGVDKRSTAESKMYRLLKNEGVRNIFLIILKELELVTPESILILMPVAVLEFQGYFWSSNIDGTMFLISGQLLNRSQNIFIIEAIEFKDILITSAFFDRALRTPLKIALR